MADKSLADVSREFDQEISPAELQDILKAIQTLKKGSGWGKVEITYTNRDMNTIEITITQKPQKVEKS